jgi:hypothetical protein
VNSDDVDGYAGANEPHLFFTPALQLVQSSKPLTVRQRFALKPAGTLVGTEKSHRPSARMYVGVVLLCWFTSKSGSVVPSEIATLNERNESSGGRQDPPPVGSM